MNMPTKHTNIYTLDFGGRQKIAWLSHNGQKAKSITYEEVFNLPKTLPPQSLLICEYAHLGCPKESSLAQPFSSKELLSLYKEFENNNIILRLFPHAMTPAALGNYRLENPEIEKADDVDPVVIYEYVIKSNITLQKPPKFFESKRDILYRQVTETPKNFIEEYWIRKNNLNTTLNIARKDNYDCDNERNDKNSQFIINHIDYIYNELIKDFSPCLIQKIFDIKINKKTNKVDVKSKPKNGNEPKWKLKIGLLYTILATLQDSDGKLLLRKNGRFPSVNHIMRYILCMSPNHLRGGIARSNIFWHGFRNYLISITMENKKPIFANIDFKRKIEKGDGGKVKVGHGNFTKEENEFFVEKRIEYMKVLKKLNYVLRRLLLPDVYDNNGYMI